MSTLKKTISRISIDEIENEIKQIDSIVNSWSSGRSLRFDPAHVRPRHLDPPSPEPERTPNPQVYFKVSFLVNLFAFCFAVGFAVAQAITGLVPAFLAAGILLGGMILMFALNLFLVIWGQAVTRKLIQTNRRLNRRVKRKTERRANI